MYKKKVGTYQVRIYNTLYNRERYEVFPFKTFLWNFISQ